jgi:hypothetical protein
MSADPQQIEMTRHNSRDLSERMLEAFRMWGKTSDLKCTHKHVDFIREEWTGRTWINVYKCKDCGRWLV